MKPRFLLKQKGGNKLKNYRLARQKITGFVLQKFGYDVDDLIKTQIGKSTIIYQQTIDDESIKAIKKLPAKTYLIEEIKIGGQKIILMISFGGMTSIKAKSGYRNHLLPENQTTIYFSVKKTN